MLEFKIIFYTFVLMLIIAFLYNFKVVISLFKKETPLLLTIQEEKAFRDFLINCVNCTSSYFEFILNNRNFIYYRDEKIFKEKFTVASSEKVSISDIKKEFIKHQRSTNTIENIDLEISKLDKSITDYEALEKDILIKLKEKEGK